MSTFQTFSQRNIPKEQNNMLINFEIILIRKQEIVTLTEICLEHNNFKAKKDCQYSGDLLLENSILGDNLHFVRTLAYVSF